MSQFLTDLLVLNAGAGAVIGVLLLVERWSGHRYGARWRCLVWLLLSVRLALPFVWTPPAAVAPVRLPAAADPVVFRYPAATPQSDPTDPSPPPDDLTSTSETPQGTLTKPSPTPPQRGAISASQLLFALWLTGGITVLAVQLIRHLRFRRWVKRWGARAEAGSYMETAKALGLKGLPPIYRCPMLQGPMVAGLVWPVLLIPEEGALSPAVLRHELYHLKRKDLWRKALLLWVTALHWFDPMVWLMARAAARDGELACDDLAAQGLEQGEKRDYAQAILDAKEGKHHE